MDALLSFCGNKELGEGVCLFLLSLSRLHHFAISHFAIPVVPVLWAATHIFNGTWVV